MRSRGKLISLFLLTAIVLSACHPLVEEEGPEELVVYATFYPIYALSERIFDGIPSMELHCLVQPQDGCLRNYELSDWDLYLLAYSADAVIEGGRGLESFSSTLTAMGGKRPRRGLPPCSTWNSTTTMRRPPTATRKPAI